MPKDLTERQRLQEVVRIAEGVHNSMKRAADSAYVRSELERLLAKREAIDKDIARLKDQHERATTGGGVASSLAAIESAKRRVKEHDNKITIQRLKRAAQELQDADVSTDEL